MTSGVHPSENWIGAVMNVRYGIKLQQGSRLAKLRESKEVKAARETELSRLSERGGLNGLLNHQYPALGCHADVKDWSRGAGS